MSRHAKEVLDHIDHNGLGENCAGEDCFHFFGWQLLQPGADGQRDKDAHVPVGSGGEYDSRSTWHRGEPVYPYWQGTHHQSQLHLLYQYPEPEAYPFGCDQIHPHRIGIERGIETTINDTVMVGVADNSPLFEEATEKGGYFFRQFPLVDDGSLVENEQKGKSIRRALCDRNGEIFTVETLSIESFHDFSQALVDLGVDNAIYLVGANAYGWATDADGQRHEFGDPNPKTSKKWRNINYIVMREAQ